MMIYNDNIRYLYDGSRWSVALLGGTRTHDMFLHTVLSFTVSHLVNAKLHRCMPKQHRQNCSSFSSESLIDSTVSTQPASGVCHKLGLQDPTDQPTPMRQVRAFIFW